MWGTTWGIADATPAHGRREHETSELGYLGPVVQHGEVSNPFDLTAWITAEPDEHNRAVLIGWQRDGIPDPLPAPLRFGTAGLRGPMGPGPGCMNRVMVRIAARALGEELVVRGTAERGVVIGHDARVDSAAFAMDSARMLTALGVPCILIDGPAPTPVVAHHGLARRAAAAVVVTASHNPRTDNGYKVYWSDGAQITSPIDQHIEQRMDIATPPTEGELAAPGQIRTITVRQALAEYLGAVIPPPDGSEPVSVVYTALCGVGAEAVDMAFATAGLAPPVHVEDQRYPDGSFPGLPFPNPEEPGTLDRAMAVADAASIDLVLANDPDADRLGVAVRGPDGWRQLTGDEIGVLLCDHLIATAGGPGHLVASSVVSGSMVPALCRHHGVEHVTTLTGFKWIMRPAIDRTDVAWLFGYEEALGYSVSDAVRDKDGISAAVAFARAVARLGGRGVNVLEKLDDLAITLGTFTTTALNVRADPDVVRQAMDRLRTDPPVTLGGIPVALVRDHAEEPEPLSTDLVVLYLGEGGRVAIRPSGTEPKVKAYLEWRDPPPGDPALQRTEAIERLTAIAAEVAGWFE